jgi:ABC-2 type transport system permease protein
MVGWKGFFDDPVPYSAMQWSASVLVAYIVLFVGITVFYFNRKDIHT